MFAGLRHPKTGVAIKLVIETGPRSSPARRTVTVHLRSVDKESSHQSDEPCPAGSRLRNDSPLKSRRGRSTKYGQRWLGISSQGSMATLYETQAYRTISPRCGAPPSRPRSGWSQVEGGERRARLDEHPRPRAGRGVPPPGWSVGRQREEMPLAGQVADERVADAVAAAGRR